MTQRPDPQGEAKLLGIMLSGIFAQTRAEGHAMRGLRLESGTYPVLPVDSSGNPLQERPLSEPCGPESR
jgi:hypothetical protein